MPAHARGPAPIERVRELERWFFTGPWPAILRWWRPQTPRTKLAIAVAGIFALASMLNLAGAGLGRVMANRPVVPVASSATTNGSAPVLTQEAAPTDPAKAWGVLKVWQGTGSRETEEFTVADHWRVDWIFSPTQSAAIFQAYIYRADGRLLMDLAANAQKGGTDSSFWAGPGKYFLKVISSGGDWKLDVQDLH